MRTVRFGAWTVPAAFALTTIVAYGLLLPLLGFYWDDWPFAWIARFLGPSEFIPAFLGFRPFLGPIFFLTTSLLPADPLAWQILALVVRFLTAWAAWYALEQVWPSNRDLAVSAALLFLLFPGYSQHWVAYTHINQEWISLGAYLLSLALSIRAIRFPSRRHILTLLAIVFQLVGLLPTEYFATQEILRGLFLWATLAPPVSQPGSRLQATLRSWWPYLLIWLVNAAWLARFYASGAYISYDLTMPNMAGLPIEFARASADAFLKAGLFVWFQILPLLSAALPSPTSLLTLVLILGSFILYAFYLPRLELPVPLDMGPTSFAKISTSKRPQSLWREAPWLAVLAGMAGILLGRIPSFAAGLPLTLQSSFDRLTISMMLGASLFLSGILHLLVHRRGARMRILAAVLAMGIGQQFYNANIFRRDWQRQQEIYWQIAWRMPGLQPDTAILTQQMPLDYETDLSMTAAVNWMFAEEVRKPYLPYAVVYTEKRLGGVVLPGLQPGLPMQLPFRTTTFRGNTSQAIVVYVPPSGCLRVFDPAFDDSVTYSRLPEAVTAAIPLSDTTRITNPAAPVSPPSPPFVQEPPHGWCYFYEKAELARQLRNWETIVDLRLQADRRGLAPQDPFEWLPFVEAEARVGGLAWAIEQSTQSLAAEPKLQRGLCALWGRVSLAGPPESRAAAGDILLGLGCDE